MSLDRREGRLIAVGASITANCQPCLAINVSKALEAGADPQEVAEAIEVGRKVRAGAASKMDAFAATVNAPAGASAPVEAKCGCS